MAKPSLPVWVDWDQSRLENAGYRKLGDLEITAEGIRGAGSPEMGQGTDRRENAPQTAVSRETPIAKTGSMCEFPKN
jgi:hypothetical protein